MDCVYRPSILVVDDGLGTSSLIKMILEKEKVSVEPKIVEGQLAYPWHIDTKYYEAEAVLYAVSQKLLLPEPLVNMVEAVVILFDSTKINGLEKVESWLPFVKDYGSDINILVCHRCSDSDSAGISKLTAQEWCVQQGFELVELDPERDEEWEADQDFVETTGIDRVVQALHAHVWPNLKLKKRKEPTSMSALLHGGDLSSVPDLDDHAKEEPVPLDLGEGDIQDRLGELLVGDSDTDFIQLFGELRTMKERVEQLPFDERLVCAEQVVLAFWKALYPDDDTAESILGTESPPPQ